MARGRPRQFTGLITKIDVNDMEVRTWAAALSKDSGQIKTMLDSKVHEITRESANEMARGAPVLTGHLKSTLWASRSVEKLGPADYTIRNLTLYGRRQNFEHRTKAGFMTNPANKAQNRMQTELEEELWRLIQ